MNAPAMSKDMILKNAGGSGLRRRTGGTANMPIRFGPPPDLSLLKDGHDEWSFGYFEPIFRSSISKISVSLGPMTGLAPRSP
jgi:hypothetical protein